MKVLLVDPHDASAQKLKDMSCAIEGIAVLDGEAVDPWLGGTPTGSVDVIVSGGDITGRREFVDALLKWRTHTHSSLIPCWFANDFKVFETGCLWPRLSIDRFSKLLDVQGVCDWLTEVSEWQQTRMHFSQSDSLLRHSPLEIVNSLALRKATGRLSLFDEYGEEGAVVVHQGSLVSAKVRHISGEEAFYEFFSWTSGSYLWEPSDLSNGSVGIQPLQTLIEEGLKLINEANIVFNFVPDLFQRIARTDSESALDDGGAQFFSERKSMYGLINGSTSVAELIHASSLSKPRAMRCLARWFSLGDIELSTRDAESPRLREAHSAPLDTGPILLSGEATGLDDLNEDREGAESSEAEDFLALFKGLDEAEKDGVAAEAESPRLEQSSVIVTEGVPFVSEDLVHADEQERAPGAESSNQCLTDGVFPPADVAFRKVSDFEAEGGALEVSTEDLKVSDQPGSVSDEVGTVTPDSALAPIRLLIVDDSRFMCIALQSMFSSDPRFEIVGTGHDGLEALKLVSQLNPDVVTLDMQMPRMDGLTALKHIMIRDPKPVVVLSAFTKETSQLTYESFKYGAVDVLTKPAGGSMKQEGMEAGRICDRVADAAGVRLEAAQYIRRGAKGRKARKIPNVVEGVAGAVDPGQSIFVMCSGMGGFPALLKFLFPISDLGNLPPIVACISMTDRAVEALVPNLEKDCDMEFELLSDGCSLKPGVCYLFSHDHCCHISRGNGLLKVQTGTNCPERRPFDHLLTSAGETCGDRSIALLLSGAGNDGFNGMRAIQRGGGLTSVLAPELCLKPDLPRKVLSDRLAKEVKTPREFIRLLEDHRSAF
jgi:two-component system chemotaxis response regulator CheB